jgi:hypothetical protein
VRTGADGPLLSSIIARRIAATTRPWAIRILSPAELRRQQPVERLYQSFRDAADLVSTRDRHQ